MSGHHPFSEFTKDFTPERRRHIESIKAKLLADTPLHEGDPSRALTREELAEPPKPKQPADVRSEMTEYERLAVASIREWKSPQLGWFGKTMEVINWPLEKSGDLMTKVPGAD